MIHTLMSGFTCTFEYEYVKLFTKALFATALMGEGLTYTGTGQTGSTVKHRTATLGISWNLS